MQFLQNYATNLKKQMKSIQYHKLSPEKQIEYPFQILFLNKKLQNIVESLEIQVRIIKENIPNKHALEHEIQTLYKSIQKLESKYYNQNNFNYDDKDVINLKIQNMKKMLNTKQQEFKEENEKIFSDNIKNSNQINDKQQFSFKSKIIQLGLIINQFYESRYQSQEETLIEEFLMSEATNILGNLISKIENIQYKESILKAQSRIQIQNQNSNNNQNQIENLNYGKTKYKYQKYYEQPNTESEEIEKIDNDVEQEVDKNQIKILPNIFIKENNEQINETEEELQTVGLIKQEKFKKLNFCDNILYVLTILNMRSMNRVIDQILPKTNNNNDDELVQFTHLCMEFFKAKQNLERPLIGLKSLEILSKFKDNINYKSQFQIYSIGLVEVLQHMLQNDSQVIVIKQFRQCFTFQQKNSEQNQILIQKNKKNLILEKLYNQQLYKYFNWLLDILPEINIYNKLQSNNFQMITYCLIIFLMKHTNTLHQQEFRIKIKNYLQSYLKTDYIEKKQEFQNQQQFNDCFEEITCLRSQKLFRSRFYKTLLNFLNSDNPQPLIKFMKDISYKNLDFIHFLKNHQFSIETAQIKYSKKEYVVKIDSLKIEEKNIIKQIKQAKEPKEQKQEQIQKLNFVKMFFQTDFVSFINQLILKTRVDLLNLKEELQKQQEYLQNQFLDTVILIQKVRQIFLKELVSENLNTSEKYIYIIQKLQLIFKEETQFYNVFINSFEIGMGDQDREIQRQQCFKKMEKAYKNYLNYLAEPKVHVEKTKLDPKLFIQEQLTFIN